MRRQHYRLIRALGRRLTAAELPLTMSSRLTDSAKEGVVYSEEAEHHTQATFFWQRGSARAGEIPRLLG